MTAYKLLRVRKDGSLGPLFINRRQRIPAGEWLEAEAHPTKGYAFRPGWHAAERPVAPHLSTKGRRWYQVELDGTTELKRPASQGSRWFLGKRMKVTGAV